MFDFTINAWFFLFVATALVLAFALAKNITNGKDLRLALGTEWKAQIAKWKARGGYTGTGN